MQSEFRVKGVQGIGHREKMRIDSREWRIKARSGADNGE